MIVDANGPVCPCGQRGCWEVLASGQGLGRLGRMALENGTAAHLSEWMATVEPAEPLEGPLLTDLASGRRSSSAGVIEEVQTILEDYTGWVAVGIISLINVLDPEVVILGGGITSDANLYSDALARHLARYPTLVGRADVVRFSRLGPDAAAVGAAMLAGCPARRI